MQPGPRLNEFPQEAGGLFFDPIGTAPPPPSIARFVKTDTTTQGSWQGIYGSQGYNVIDNASSYPSYAQVSAGGKGNFIWNSSTTDLRALQDVGSSNRIDAWRPWNCLNVAGAWVGPEESEFARILEGKAELAKGYDLAGAELWLLVVCETFGDVESHIFPQDEESIAVLEAKIRETGFDFAAGPFAEVWLLSAFTGRPRRIHPPYS